MIVVLVVVTMIQGMMEVAVVLTDGAGEHDDESDEHRDAVTYSINRYHISTLNTRRHWLHT